MPTKQKAPTSIRFDDVHEAQILQFMRDHNVSRTDAVKMLLDIAAGAMEKQVDPRTKLWEPATNR